jgi:hypothetical protein
MSDYEVTTVNQSDNPLTHFDLFSYCNLVTFDDTVKETKWKKDMNNEINVIEKKNWKLENLFERRKDH